MKNISTHILTKRMTAHASEFPLYQNISTHILTKRMTLLFPLCSIRRLYFNSHPHEEDDEDLERDGAVDDISTHILTKRMTEFAHKIFGKGEYFNSHPHEEDDSNFKQK